MVDQHTERSARFQCCLFVSALVCLYLYANTWCATLGECVASRCSKQIPIYCSKLVGTTDVKRRAQQIAYCYNGILVAASVFFPSTNQAGLFFRAQRAGTWIPPPHYSQYLINPSQLHVATLLLSKGCHAAPTHTLSCACRYGKGAHVGAHSTSTTVCTP